uniref:Uncharacterized protein n=1 Tax=Timema poppense TaxID=170557 RepID=A0A7R9GW05_TIMPO|nr:unnamed protein product [Timema poppensis]
MLSKLSDLESEFFFSFSPPLPENKEEEIPQHCWSLNKYSIVLPWQECSGARIHSALGLENALRGCSVPDSFVNSQEWTLSRNVPDLRLGIVGSLSSGKSALVHRYLTGSYMQEESPEGGRFKKEILVDGQSYLLLIRDEGGPPELQVNTLPPCSLVLIPHFGLLTSNTPLGPVALIPQFGLLTSNTPPCLVALISHFCLLTSNTPPCPGALIPHFGLLPGNTPPPSLVILVPDISLLTCSTPPCLVALTPHFCLLTINTPCLVLIPHFGLLTSNTPCLVLIPHFGLLTSNTPPCPVALIPHYGLLTSNTPPCLVVLIPHFDLLTSNTPPSPVALIPHFGLLASNTSLSRCPDISLLFTDK